MTELALPETSALATDSITSVDDKIVAMWLHGRGPHTTRAYRRDAARLRGAIGKNLGSMTLADLQAYADGLTGSTASRARRLASVKSLFAFAQKLGCIPYDTARPLKLPPMRDDLPQRILTEVQVQKIFAVETSPRNSILLRMLYASGARASEICALCWKDAAARDAGGQVSLFGKGGKSRVVLLPASVWSDLIAYRADAPDDARIFNLTPGQVCRIVAAIAKLAKIPKHVTTHWLRHAHASHALDHGCPPHVVQATLGHASLVTTTRYSHARPDTGSGLYLPV